MNDDQLDDLKQFIDSKISQSEARLKSEMATKDDLSSMATKDDIKQLRAEMQEGFAGVADAIESLTSDIDQRVTNLQEKIA